MAKIDIFNRKMVQNDQNLRSRAWVCEGPNRSSNPKAACKGPSRSLPPGPSKGSKMVKIWSNLGSLKGPPRSFRTKGTNRHILARAKSCAQEGSKWSKMTKIDFSQDAKSGQNDQNLRFWAGVCEALSRSSSPKAARKGSSHNLPPGPSKGVQNGQN